MYDVTGECIPVGKSVCSSHLELVGIRWHTYSQHFVENTRIFVWFASFCISFSERKEKFEETEINTTIQSFACVHVVMQLYHFHGNHRLYHWWLITTSFLIAIIIAESCGWWNECARGVIITYIRKCFVLITVSEWWRFYFFRAYCTIHGFIFFLFLAYLLLEENTV